MVGGSEHHSLYANRDSIHRKNSPFYGPSGSRINPKATAIAVRGEQLNYVGLNVRNRAHAYIAAANAVGMFAKSAMHQRTI